MKLRNLLLVAFFVPALFCPAQDKTSASQPAAASPAAPATAAPAMDPTYVIGPSDEITVSVFKEPDLSGTLLVRPDGMISVPLLGDVLAAGKTPMHLASDITDKLKKYVQDPDVTVILNQTNSKRVYLIGEVGRTGPIDMTSGMTLLQAIATAGGLTEFANTKKIYILRNKDGKQEKIRVHYKEALRGDLSLNLVLKPGDTIVVP